MLFAKWRKPKIRTDEDVKLAVRQFCDENVGVACLVFAEQTEARRKGRKLSEEYVRSLIPPHLQKEMTFSAAELLTYM